MPRLALAIILGLVAASAVAVAQDILREEGRALFERAWADAPASEAGDGLGPLYTERACASCHRDAGPAQFLDMQGGKLAVRGLVARFGDAVGRPDPAYGRQLQTHAVQGLAPEGRLAVAKPRRTGGGLDAGLTLNGPPLDAATRMSIRQAPGLGRIDAIERVDAAAAQALADPEDRDGDGISGRARLVDGRQGRFGWKAGGADLAAQIADAFAADMGLSSAHRPAPYGDCTPRQADCRAAASNAAVAAGPEDISRQSIDGLAAFLRALPSRRAGSPAGAVLFAATGCAACHVPDMPAAGGGTAEVFSDLLLHDMGPALDDGVGEPGVHPREWRTAPLSRLAQAPRRRYLHDGRAATLDEALILHGGEASQARRRYLDLAETGRAALIAYLEGL